MNMNPYYFTGLKCDKCGAQDCLYKSRDLTSVVCEICLNKMIESIEPKEKEYKVDVIINEVEE